MRLLASTLVQFSNFVAIGAFWLTELNYFLLEVLQLSPYRVVSFCHCEKSSHRWVEIIKLPFLAENTIELYDLNDTGRLDELNQFRSIHRNVLIDINCPRGEKVMQQLSAKRAVNESMYFFLLATDLNTTVEYVKTLDVQINSKITLIVPVRNGYDVYGVHSPGLYRTGKIYFNRIGWCSYQLLASYDRHCIITPPKLSYDMEGSPLSISFVLPKTPPGKVVLHYAMSTIPHDYGFNFVRSVNPVVKLYAEYYNFTIHWVRVDNWGYLLDDNVTFSGAVGMMQRREVNLSTSTMIYMPARARHIDSGLGGPILVRQRYVFRHPRSGRGVSTVQNAFLRPLDTDVWIVIGIISVIGVVIFTICIKYEQETVSWEGVSSTIVTIIGILALQGYNGSARSVYFRFTILTFVVFSYFLQQYYSASIIGTLLTPFPKTIKTVKGLTNSDLHVILENVPSAPQIIKFYSPELYDQKIAKQKSTKTYSIADGLKKVKKGGFAFFVYIDQAREIIKRNFTLSEIDDLQEIDYVDDTHLLITYFPVQKFAPCREVIRVANRKVVEVGLSSYWNTRYVSTKPFGTDSQYSIADVTLVRISTLLFLLAYGLLGSVMILFAEVLVKKKTLLRSKRVTTTIKNLLNKKIR